MEILFEALTYDETAPEVAIDLADFHGVVLEVTGGDETPTLTLHVGAQIDLQEAQEMARIASEALIANGYEFIEEEEADNG